MFPTRRVCRYVPESARWLLTQGRKEEARQQLQRAARVNKRSLPTDALDKVTPTGRAKNSDAFLCSTSDGLLDLCDLRSFS